MQPRQQPPAGCLFSPSAAPRVGTICVFKSFMAIQSLSCFFFFPFPNTTVPFSHLPRGGGEVGGIPQGVVCLVTFFLCLISPEVLTLKLEAQRLRIKTRPPPSRHVLKSRPTYDRIGKGESSVSVGFF